MKNRTKIKSIILYAIGLFLCTGPVLAAILSYFPLWRDSGGGRLVSGGVLLLVILAWVPLIRLVKRIVRSPAAHTMWFLLFVLFFALSKIADEMTVISFVGFVGNSLGAILFKLSGLRKPEGGGE